MEQTPLLLQLAAGTGATAAVADLGGRSSSIPVSAAEADVLETAANRDASSHLDEVEQDDSLMYSMTSAAVWGLLREMLER